MSTFGPVSFLPFRIHHGEDVGVFIFEDGEGMFEENDISHNSVAGVELQV